MPRICFTAGGCSGSALLGYGKSGLRGSGHYRYRAFSLLRRIVACNAYQQSEVLLRQVYPASVGRGSPFPGIGIDGDLLRGAFGGCEDERRRVEAERRHGFVVRASRKGGRGQCEHYVSQFHDMEFLTGRLPVSHPSGGNGKDRKLHLPVAAAPQTDGAKNEPL